MRGALAGGATRVVVNDAHSTMRNLPADRIHPEAVLVGYHARAGALGVLSHSYLGHEIEDMWLDDRPLGEIGFAHAAAAASGRPW